MLQLPHSENGATVAPSPASRNHDHANAFRELEDAVCQCAQMARIAANLLVESDRRQYPDDVFFAVTHTSEMIDALKDKYYASGWPSAPE